MEMCSVVVGHIFQQKGQKWLMSYFQKKRVTHAKKNNANLIHSHAHFNYQRC